MCLGGCKCCVKNNKNKKQGRAHSKFMTVYFGKSTRWITIYS